MTGIGTNITGNVVMVFWDPLPEDQWNGLPLGYYVSDVYDCTCTRVCMYICVHVPYSGKFSYGANFHIFCMSAL